MDLRFWHDEAIANVGQRSKFSVMSTELSPCPLWKIPPPGFHQTYLGRTTELGRNDSRRHEANALGNAVCSASGLV